VESLSPHRIVPADAEEMFDEREETGGKKRGPLSASETDFASMVIEHLKSAGVHQTERADRIEFTSVTSSTSNVPWQVVAQDQPGFESYRPAD